MLWLWWGERNTQREAYVTVSLSDRFPTTEKTPQAAAAVQRKRWLKPPDGILKLNTDGAFSERDKKGGWGFVIRNDEGQVVKAGVDREDFFQDAFHAELLGALSGVREAATLGISQSDN